MTARFTRTAAAAVNDRLTRWDLIEAIADDAVENGLPITGAQSVDAAHVALEAAGADYALGTVAQLALVAKFDHESTARQRKVWRRYGWAAVLRVARAGWTPEAAAELLTGDHKTVSEIADAVRPKSHRNENVLIDDRWAAWVVRMNKLMSDAASLLSESDGEVLNGQSELAVAIYQRITERQLDAEIRQLLETADR